MLIDCTTHMSPGRGLRKLGEEMTLLSFGQSNARIVHFKPEIDLPPMPPFNIISDVSASFIA